MGGRSVSRWVYRSRELICERKWETIMGRKTQHIRNVSLKMAWDFMVGSGGNIFGWHVKSEYRDQHVLWEGYMDSPSFPKCIMLGLSCKQWLLVLSCDNCDSLKQRRRSVPDSVPDTWSTACSSGERRVCVCCCQLAFYFHINVCLVFLNSVSISQWSLFLQWVSAVVSALAWCISFIE